MGKHIEDIHAFPLPLLHPCRQAGVKLLSCLASLGGGLVTPAKSTGHRPKRGVRRAWSKVGSFSTLGCFVWMWACSGTFIGAEHTVGTSRWNSSGRAGDDPGWFYREWIVLIAPGKDREAWVNHVHPPWWSCLGHAVFACTVIRHGSILSELQLARVIQHGLHNFPMKIFRWLTYKTLHTAADLLPSPELGSQAVVAVRQWCQGGQSWRMKGFQGVWLHLGLLFLFFFAKKNKNVFPLPNP